MDEGAMVVAVVFIGCISSLAGYAIKMIFGPRAHAKPDAMLDEIRALREEMQTLRRQNNDVMLALDTGMQRIDQRITHVETRGQLGAGSARPLDAEVPESAAQRR